MLYGEDDDGFNPQIRDSMDPNLAFSMIGSIVEQDLFARRLGGRQ